MATKSRDQEIVDILIEKIGLAPNVEYDKEGNLTSLDLSKCDLSEFPLEIAQLSNLQELILGKSTRPNEKDLRTNHLSQLPPEIGNLTNLRSLILSYNDLSQLPPEIGNLTNLQELNLSRNPLSHFPLEITLLSNLRRLIIPDTNLSQLPPEIGNLTNLQELILGKDTGPTDRHLRTNHLSQLPPEVGNLTNLRSLILSYNDLSQLPPEIGNLTNLQELNLSYNPLSHFPLEIAQLSNLRKLFLTETHLSQLPSEIGNLTNLERLILHDNDLSQLPPEIGNLTNLSGLYMIKSHLSQLPPEIGNLTNLQELYIHHNDLAQLPPEIGNLTNLRWLDLAYNNLSQLPPEIGNLTNLERLALHHNNLSQLPPEIGNLTNLQSISVNDNPDLLTPPPEIAMRGTDAMLSFLQELQKNSILRFEVKLLIVGEGGTGKSSLLRSLRNEEFDPHSPTTHGIEVNHLCLPHPDRPQTEIILNTWDFGGQHIYHATHQFFLTRRSLYLIVWNARLGAEQGRLHHWLDTIRALAPDAPILLVATHTDERAPDLNYQMHKDDYSQLVANLSVSNKNRTGLSELKVALAYHAAKIHLIGQPWPRSWLEVEEYLLSLPDHHIDARTYTDCCATTGIEAEIAKGTLGNYLHDLGKILYFRDDPVLSNLVVLNPNWVTKAISHILTDETTSKANGILYHSRFPQIWATDDDRETYEPHLYSVFLRLMERFDLSYQIDPEMPGSPSTRSLVPQLLPHQPPANLPPWPEIPINGQAQVEMLYRLDFVPPGTMSWFIVRTHHYTQNLHWREGVILKYQDHYARVELNPKRKELRLVVWGIQPHNFFTILMNTLDLILERFEGLRIQRDVPCNCYWQRKTNVSCPSYYPYEYLIRRMNAGKYEVECRESFLNVSVPELLYGIHMSTNENVIADIRQGQQQLLQGQQQMFHDLTILPKMVLLLNELNQRSELLWRTLLKQWNFEMQNMEEECPSIFYLALGKSKHFNPKNWVSQKYRLCLICQDPSDPHPVGDGYTLREAKDWWIKISPWLNHLITFLKFAIPMGKAIGDVYDTSGFDRIKNQIALVEEIMKNIPELSRLDSPDSTVSESHLNHNQKAVGSALRVLYSFLDKVDSEHIWGGLNKTVTPEGNILWLCETHRQQYESKPLDPSYASNQVWHI